MTVYVVLYHHVFDKWVGYVDTVIVGVYASRELAEKSFRGVEYTIEEWEVATRDGRFERKD